MLTHACAARPGPFALRPSVPARPRPGSRRTSLFSHCHVGTESISNRCRCGIEGNSVCVCGRRLPGHPGATVRDMTVGAVLDDGSDELVVTEIDVDSPGPREVAVRTLATGLCHSDLHYLDGVLTRPRPMLLGHEAVGVVEAVGPGVESVVVGDHVVTCLVVGCGTCARCEQGEPFVCSNPNATRRPRGERRGSSPPTGAPSARWRTSGRSPTACSSTNGRWCGCRHRCHRRSPRSSVVRSSLASGRCSTSPESARPTASP